MAERSALRLCLQRITSTQMKTYCADSAENSSPHTSRNSNVEPAVERIATSSSLICCRAFLSFSRRQCVDDPSVRVSDGSPCTRTLETVNLELNHAGTKNLTARSYEGNHNTEHAKVAQVFFVPEQIRYG